MVRLLHTALGFVLIGWLGIAQASVPALLPASDDIVLGQSAPLSGNFKELGLAYRDGARLVFDQVNRQGGIGGHRIRLVTLDDGYVAARAQANTQTLIEQDKAVALFGHMFTNTVFASLPLANAAGVAFVAPYAGNAELYARPANPLLFMTRASYGDELDALMRHVQAMGSTRVAMVRYDSAGGIAMQHDVEEKLQAIGLKPLGVASMRLNSLDPAVAATSLAALQPNAIVLGVSGADAVAFVRAFDRANQHKPVQFLARSLIGGHQLVTDLGVEGRGIVISQAAPSPFNGKTRISREYATALKAQSGAQSVHASYIGFEGYIAAKVMVEGLRRAGANLSRAGVVKGLASLQDWDEGDFLINYSPNDHAGSKFVTVTVIGAGGHFIE